MAEVKSAYKCRVVAYQLLTVHDPRERSECATVDDAVQRLTTGADVTVAACDMGQLRSRLASFGVG